MYFLPAMLAAGGQQGPNRRRPVSYGRGRGLDGVRWGYRPNYAKHRSEPPTREPGWKRQGWSNHTVVAGVRLLVSSFHVCVVAVTLSVTLAVMLPTGMAGTMGVFLVVELVWP